MSACADLRMSLGVYALGALDPEEAVLVEAHLATCPECRAEFEEISGLGDLLARVSEEDIEQASRPPQAVLDRLIAASARRRRLHRLMFGLAASVLAVVVGGTAWMVADGRPSGGGDTAVVAVGAPAASRAAPEAAARGQQSTGEGPAEAKRFGGTQAPVQSPLVAADLQQGTPPPAALRSPGPQTRVPLEKRQGPVQARIVMTPGGEGTSIEVSVSGVADGTSCRVIALGLDGTESPVASWTVGGGDKNTAEATFAGHTELTIDRIRGFVISDSTGKRLLSIDYTP
ncbi:hypothetical protein Sme01_57530 [Sphaerisporangium melleum]|uniref:Putative zinc-finger domain-containing protein n=1 Tax=Sphaerisporangium melleum TaxID=321316 RepID=A0A917VKZ3_9ACTN|nr:zf-HC2 domain-containing protein [Sphaerisporangium melleum]GGK94810.1 hypothetical protein GCM10007964_41410 [Sphaerisporangium melleum]GII73277.1 hypothetical protein Sme01_57530 [Sphaerisporangium melleum]